MNAADRFPPLLGVVVALGIGMAVFVDADRRGREARFRESWDAAAARGASRRAQRDREEQQAQDEVGALVAELQTAYEGALADGTRIPPFLAALNQRVEVLSQPKAMAFDAANYTTKLLIARLRAQDYEAGEVIVRNYLDNLLVHTGLSPKSLDVAANALVLPQRNQIFPEVERHILGEGFDMAEIEHALLLFNLACYHAINANKPKMLQAIRLAMAQGKPREQFLADADFDAYKHDPDFLAALDGR